MKRLVLFLFSLPLLAQTPPLAPVFVNGGVHLNDLTSGGIANNGAGPHIFQVNVTSGAPDQQQWNEDGGTFTALTNIAAGTPVTMADGATFTFAAATGHTTSTATSNFWIIDVVVSGTISQSTFVQRGQLGTFRSVETKLRENVNALDYGAVCNGITDPTNALFHDDWPALMAAQTGFPLEKSYGTAGIAPSGYFIYAGAVTLPVTSQSGPGGGVGACIIGASHPGLQWSQAVKLQCAAPGTACVISTEDGFAPMKPGTTRETVTGVSGGGGTIYTITVGATTGYANGDTVVLQGVDGGTGPCWQLNSATSGYLPGPWTISGLTATSFTLANSSGIPACVWVSGGTVVNGTEKFVLTLVNSNPGAPNDNFNQDIGDIVIQSNSPMSSGINCNCSVGTKIHGVSVSVGYRSVVGSAGGTDNVILESLAATLGQVTATTGGPDPQGLVLYGNGGIGTHSVLVTNYKEAGFPGGPSSVTPTIFINGIGINMTVPQFENVPWPGANFAGTSIHIDGINASTDNYSPYCPVSGGAMPGSLFPQVWTIFAAGGASILGSDIQIYGAQQCYAAGLNSVGYGNPVLDQQNPATGADVAFYPIDYTSKFPFSAQGYILPSGTIYGGIVPVHYASSDGINLTPAAYFYPSNGTGNGGGQLWYRSGASVPAGYKWWHLSIGGEYADTNPASIFGAGDTYGALTHQFWNFSAGGGYGCTSGFRVCFDPLAVEGTGIAGNADIVGNLAIHGTCTGCGSGSAITALTGGVSASGPGSAAATLNLTAGAGIGISGAYNATITNSAPFPGGGVSCSGAPTASFASVNGVVTHC